MTTPARVQPAQSPQRALSIGVVGAGKVGAVLAARLRAAGHRVTGAAGESDASRKRAVVPAARCPAPQAERRRA